MLFPLALIFNTFLEYSTYIIFIYFEHFYIVNSFKGTLSGLRQFFGNLKLIKNDKKTVSDIFLEFSQIFQNNLSQETCR